MLEDPACHNESVRLSYDLTLQRSSEGDRQTVNSVGRFGVWLRLVRVILLLALIWIEVGADTNRSQQRSKLKA